MGCVQQAVLEFDEEVQAPWRPRLVSVRRRRRRGGPSAAAAPVAPQPVAGGRLPSGRAPAPAPAGGRPAGDGARPRRSRAGRVARRPAVGVPAPSGRPAPASGSPGGRGGSPSCWRWPRAWRSARGSGRSSPAAARRSAARRGEQRRRAAGRHAVVDRDALAATGRRPGGRRRDPGAQRARRCRAGARSDPPPAVSGAVVRSATAGAPTCRARGRDRTAEAWCALATAEGPQRPGRLRQPSVRARSHSVVDPSAYGRHVSGAMENRAAVFTSQPQAVEVYQAGAWWAGELLGWRHDADGSCQVWVRVVLGGVEETAWTDLDDPAPARAAPRRGRPSRASRRRPATQEMSVARHPSASRRGAGRRRRRPPRPAARSAT